MKPVILITSYYVSKDEIQNKRVRGTKGQDMSMCTMDYIRAVENAGGIPLVAPSIEDEEAIDGMIALADGILFSGGEDLHPKYYNEEIQVDNMTIAGPRDSFEIKLARKVLESDKPLLAICRGMQLLNVAAGGTLYQDIDFYLQTDIRHSNPGNYKWDIVHPVDIRKSSKLYDVYNSGRETESITSVEVNSFHHQAIKELADMFTPIAYAPDMLVEAYEAKGERFLLGVQWHPEMMFEKHHREHQIFKYFVKSAEAYKNERQ